MMLKEKYWNAGKLTERQASKIAMYYWRNLIDSSKCPRCKSNNIAKLDKRFWGCFDCKFGFFEQFDEPEYVRPIVKEKLNLPDYSEYFTIVFIAVKEVRKKEPKKIKKEVAIQLSLF